MGDYSKASLLFVEPSFALGAARVLDLGATLNGYNYSMSESEADLKAVWADWATVGDDLFKAMSSYRESEGRIHA